MIRTATAIYATWQLCSIFGCFILLGMRTILGIATGAFLTLALATSVLADAQIAFIKPAQGHTLLEPPDRVRIFFKEPVEGEFLEVHDGQGNRVDEDDARVEPPFHRAPRWKSNTKRSTP